METRECRGCGIGFQAKNRCYRFCSDLCRKNVFTANTRARYLKKRIIRPLADLTCLMCVKTFRSRRWGKKYCSLTCATRGHRLLQAAWFKTTGRALARGEVVRRKCGDCNREFKVSLHNKIYCSRHCKQRGYGGK